jgi:hypothetical protein
MASLILNVPDTAAAGRPLTLSWSWYKNGALSSYNGFVLWRKVDDDTEWKQVYEGSDFSYTDTVDVSWSTVTYYVCTYKRETKFNSDGSYAEESVTYDSDSDDMTVTVLPLVITCDEVENGGDLGVQSSLFAVHVVLEDYVSRRVEASAAVDGEPIRGIYFKSVVIGKVVETYSFYCGLSADIFYNLSNGSHTLTITASDSNDHTATYALTFTRQVSEAIVTLDTPFDADDQITSCALEVDGDIPEDRLDTDWGYFLVQVTNNAKDSMPTWEDCTTEVKSGDAYSFQNETAANGFSFNFRVRVCRGATDTGGYIRAIRGGFQ